MPDPGQQQDKDHRGKQEPEDTQDVETEGEEAAKVRVEERVIISGAIQILLDQPTDLQGADEFRDDHCGGF